jgi:hypothetical protein
MIQIDLLENYQGIKKQEARRKNGNKKQESRSENQQRTRKNRGGKTEEKISYS